MRSEPTGRRGDPATLRRRIARGDYVVDERAVADAMLSRMLVPAQLFGPLAAGADERHTGSGLDGPDPGDR